MECTEEILHPEASSTDNSGTEVPATDYRLLFEAVPDPCLVLDTGLRIVAVNDAYLRTTMTKREEILGRGIFEVLPDNPEDDSASSAQNMRASLDRVLADGLPDTITVLKYDIRKPQEEGGGFEERYWSLVHTPVLGADGEISWIIHRALDVTKFVHDTQTAAAPDSTIEIPAPLATTAAKPGYGKRRGIMAGAGFLMGVALLFLLGWLGHRSLMEIQTETRGLIQSYKVVAKLGELCSDLLEAEAGAGERGFLRTNDPSARAHSRIAEDLAAIKVLTAENPGQRQRLEGIDAMVRGKLAELRSKAGTRNTDGYHEARGTVRTGPDKLPTNTVLARIAEATTTETDLLKGRFAQQEAKTAKLEGRLLAGSILMVALGAIVFTLFMRGIILRALAEDELHSHQKKLYGLLEDHTRANEELARQREKLEEINGRLEAEVKERVRIQELLKAANVDLVRSNKELEMFASVASHDLQEPLHTITSYTELLEHKYKDRLDAKANTYIGYIVDGTSRMHLLINDLLAYSRVGTRAKPFGPVAMEAVLDLALTNLRKSIAESRATVEHEELPEVQGDDAQMSQLLQNLIGNAIKYRNKEVRLQIRISAKRAGNEWVFGVHDNGIGIEPRFSERIFGIFQRLHTREEYEGSGMGLAICRKIVEHHGGRIWVESSFGEGSSFYFTMPARGESHGI